MTQKESRAKRFLDGDLSGALLLLSVLFYLASGFKAVNTLLEDQSIPDDWFAWTSASLATGFMLSIIIIFLIFNRMDKKEAMREVQDTSAVF